MRLYSNIRLDAVSQETKWWWGGEARHERHIFSRLKKMRRHWTEAPHDHDHDHGWVSEVGKEMNKIHGMRGCIISNDCRTGVDCDQIPPPSSSKSTVLKVRWRNSEQFSCTRLSRRSKDHLLLFHFDSLWLLFLSSAYVFQRKKPGKNLLLLVTPMMSSLPCVSYHYQNQNTFKLESWYQWNATFSSLVLLIDFLFCSFSSRDSTPSHGIKMFKWGQVYFL